MDVISVDNSSLGCQALKDTRKCTLERNLIAIICVDNTLLKYPTLKTKREFTKASKNVITVVKASLI